MTTDVKPSQAGNGLFDGDPRALMKLADQAFATAAERAVAENDRRGIPTHGAQDGKLVVRKPKAARQLDHD